MAFKLNPDGTLTSQAAEQPGGGAADAVIETTTERFMADVIEPSMSVPVIVDFWAPWCGPCKQLGPMLEKLVRQAAGAVRLVKINVDENQQLAAQLRVQTIPTVFAFRGGQPVDGFSGALPESQLRAFIARLTGGAASPVDQALEQAKARLEAGDAAGAAALYGEILKQDPTSAPAIAGMIRAAIAAGDAARARKLVEGLTEKLAADKDIAAAISALELAEQTAGGGDAKALAERLERDPNDHEARYELALALYGSGDTEGAIAELLELVRRDRAWRDEAARKQLVKIFDALGPSHPLTVESRRRLSTILFS